MNNRKYEKSYHGIRWPEFKLSKYTIQVFILIAILFNDISTLSSQVPLLNNQDPLWVLGDQTVSFTGGVDHFNSPTPLPTPTEHIPIDYPELGYSGKVAQLHQNAQYDIDGNLLFFIIDGFIYNDEGYLIADPNWLYQNDSWEDNVGCDVCIQANSADVIISPVPNQCNLFYLIFTEIHPINNPGVQAHYMILDIEGPNQYFDPDDEITGRLLHRHDDINQNTLAEFSNFNQSIFDETNFDDRGILFYSEGAVNNQPYVFMELLDFKGNENKHLYMAYDTLVWRFLVREDKIQLKSIYSYKCNEITVEYDDDPPPFIPLGNNISSIWDEIESPISPTPPLNENFTKGGDMQIHYVENIGKNVMVHNSFIAPFGPTNYNRLFFTTLNDDGSLDSFLGCIPYENVDIFGFNFSENGNFFYLNYGLTVATSGGIQCWELNIDERHLVNLPNIPHSAYSIQKYYQSRIEDNLFEDYNVLYTVGEGDMAILLDINDPSSVEMEEIDMSPNIDLTGYLYWWTGESTELPYTFRFLNKQNYKDAPMTDYLHDPVCCFPVLDETGIGNMTFTADETWTYGNNPFGNTTEPIIVKGTFTFEAGSKIDIENMELMFGPDAKIMIEPGARLIIDGATLTSACNVFWRGIFVVGNTNEYQAPSKQGYLITKNNTVISNATFAVRNYGLNSSGGIDPNKSGGIIRATETDFINNKMDVRMRTYKRYYASGSPRYDLSYFRKCNFITEDNMFEEPDITHVNLYDVNTVAFSGCLFEDSRSDLETFEKSIGISSNQAAFLIKDYFSTQASFIDLQYAIKAWDYSEATITIEDATFNSYKGVYFNGIDHAEILANDFNVAKLTDDGATGDFDYPYGLYLEMCTDYSVNDNIFTGTENSNPGSNFGLVVHNNHSINTRVRNNEFNNFTVGAEAIGQNKDGIDEEKGLQLLCNDATNNEFDIAVVSLAGDLVNGIALNQGQSGTETTDPAGNLFSTGSVVDVNYKNKTDHINYFHHNSFAEPRVRPTTDGDISLFGNLEIYNPDLSCIIPIDGGGDDDEISLMLSNMNEASGSIVQINTELSSLIDGGNTQQLENEVVMTTDDNAWINYLQLMAESGYLSEDVLGEVSKKETGFSQAMIRNILAANPQAAKSSEIQTNLNERLDPLPDYMREQINLGLTQISAKEYLEWMRGNQKIRFDRLLNQVLKTWMADTVLNHATEVIDLLSNIHPGGQAGDLRNEYRLVDYYDSKGESTLGDMLLDVINGYPLNNIQQQDYNNYIDFRNLLHQWKQNGVNMAMLDEAQITTLNDFTLMCYPIGARAMALLFLNNALEYNEPLYIPESGDKSNAGGIKQSGKATNNLLVLFPNPSNDYFTVDYSLVEAFNNGKLIILDANGKTIHQVNINFTRDQLIIAVDNWPSGQYSCVILTDGKTMLTEKITIIK